MSSVALRAAVSEDAPLFSNTVSASSVLALVQAAQALGVPVDDLLEETGIAELLASGATRVAERQSHGLWERVGFRSGDQYFGLRAAQAIRRGTFRVTEYAIRNSKTVGDAVGYLQRYSRLLNDGMQVQTHRVGSDVHIQYRVLGLPMGPPRHLAEFTVARIVIVVRELTHQPVAPLSVSFQHPRPFAIECLSHFFGCPLHFRAPQAEIVLPASILEFPIQQADLELATTVSAYADEQLAKLPQASDLLTRVRFCITEGLCGQQASVEDVSSAIGMSARTLQRKLRERGTSFEEQLDEVRRYLAVRYLLDTAVPMADIAARLGYSEAGALHRAFKRWTGQTPQQYRKHAASSGTP
jgi:AraC-like DNA-binding protein